MCSKLAFVLVDEMADSLETARFKNGLVELTDVPFV
jgi:hypothetical protein